LGDERRQVPESHAQTGGRKDGRAAGNGWDPNDIANSGDGWDNMAVFNWTGVFNGRVRWIS
jgi:hypothetical protein